MRRRLVLEGLAEGALRGAWIAAIGVGIGSGVHLLLVGHAGAPIALAALLGLFGAAGLAAARAWPTLERAASQADRRFDTRDLFTSAADLLARPAEPRPAAAGFVLTSAEARARECLGRLGPIRLGLRRFLAPAALLGCFTLGYSLPGAAPEPAALTVTPTAAVERVEAAGSDASAPVDPLDRLRAVARAAAWGGGPEAARRADRVASDRPVENHDDRRGRLAEPAALGSTRAAAARAPETGAAGDGPRVDVPRQPRPASPPLVVRFALLAAAAERGGPGGRVHSQAGLPLGDSADPAVASRTGSPNLLSDALAARRYEGTGGVSRASIRPLLRAYAADYVREIQDLDIQDRKVQEAH